MALPAHRPVVLIVGDDETNGMYDLALSLAGFSFLHATSGVDAAWQAHDDGPDVIVADLALEGALDGVSMLRCIQGGRRAQGPGIVLLADDASPSEVIAPTGCHLVLRKPCRPDELVAGISLVIASAADVATPASAACPVAAPGETLPGSVAACHELIRQLHSENIHLRQAGTFFGQLAERLNHQLRQHQNTAVA
jgi:DNA-binding response OmpR family regulator